MTKTQHRAMIKKLAKWICRNVQADLNILGIETALAVNFCLTIRKSTLNTLYGDYKRCWRQRRVMADEN